MRFRRGVKGALTATGVAVGIGALMAAAAFGPTRKLVERRVPAPGEGPSREERENGFFVMELTGKGESDQGPFRVRGRVEGTNDPGYGETSKMLGEAGLCLAFDDLEGPGGVLTPASSMGKKLLERLRAAGMVFEAE